MNNEKQIMDYIENFDEKNIQICFLSTIGRSGSNLLHSLFDNHHEILTLPTIFWYYFDIVDMKEDYFKDADKLVQFYLNKSLFSTQWYSSFFNDNIEEYKRILLEIVNDLKNLNSKTFLLALHFAYAKLQNIEIENIKII